MTISLVELIQFSGNGRRPSVEVAKYLLGKKSFGLGGPKTKPTSFLDEYDDQGFTPSLEKIEAWISETSGRVATRETAKVVRFLADLDDTDSELSKSLSSCLYRYTSGEIDFDGAVDAMSALWAWMDTSPVWNGMPEDDDWLSGKATSAYTHFLSQKIDYEKRTANLTMQVRDELGHWLDQMLNEPPTRIDSTKMMTVLDKLELLPTENEGRLDQIIANAIRLGFLYRDAWWLDTHGDAALKGYIAKETSAKAGAGGAASSSTARLKKIRCFLEVHANLIRDNRALTELPPEVVADLALKLARKAHPRVRTHNQNMTVAARAIAERNTVGDLS